MRTSRQTDPIPMRVYVRLKVANFHLGGRGEEGETSFREPSQKLRGEGEEILCWVLLCVTRATKSIYTTLRGAFRAAHPLRAVSLRTPPNLAFLFFFFTLLFV